MGAGQIGGIATLLDIDFNNAAGFIGTIADVSEAQYVVYFLSHAMMFCTGSLIEAHVVLTTANCVFGEKYRFDVYGGSHKFLEAQGTSRLVEHMAIHRGYNHSLRFESCSPDNLAILVLGYQFKFHKREEDTDFVISRLRYGLTNSGNNLHKIGNCKFYGWGSRRNGYLVPLLIHLRRVDVHILEKEMCQQMWNYGEKYLCVQQFPCKSEKHGALCPDDLGTVIECSGYLRGIMTSRLIDRPCGIGFLDMTKYAKFLTCGVDDSRDILGHNDYMEFEFESSTVGHMTTPHVECVDIGKEPEIEKENDPGPPTTPNIDDEEVAEQAEGLHIPEAQAAQEAQEAPEAQKAPEVPEAPEAPESHETVHEANRNRDNTF